MTAVRGIAIVGVVAGTTALTTYFLTQDKFKTTVTTGITTIGAILAQIFSKG